MKKKETKEIKYYELDGKKYFFSDKNLVKNNEDHSILFNDGEQIKKYRYYMHLLITLYAVIF